MIMRKGDRGPHVQELQGQLLLLGVQLPRWGADGAMGDETLSAAHELLRRLRPAEVDTDETMLTEREIAAIQDLHDRHGDRSEQPACYIDCRDHELPKAHLVKVRPWSQITAIVLHQTACTLGERPQRWYSVPIHIGITKQGRMLHLNDLTYNLPHANSFNSRSVGIEIDGSYEGIEGDRKTWWAGGQTAPDTLSPAAVQAARDAIVWIYDEVRHHGGKVTHILAHRQSSKDRVSDPGSAIWQQVGMWAQHSLELSDGGEGYQAGGLPLPSAWDARRLARY